jgi:hypothetical protein
MLYVPAERLHEVDALNHPGRGRRLIEHSMTLNPALAGLGPTIPDGQLMPVREGGLQDDLSNRLDREACRSMVALGPVSRGCRASLPGGNVVSDQLSSGLLTRG